MAFIASELESHFQELLVPVAAEWGLSIGPAKLARLHTYTRELLGWNEQVNLTRITAPRDVVVRHFLDSLAFTRAFDEPPASLVDVGTGGGFPGIPLKIVWPELRLTLTDSVGKKTAFLRHVVDVLELTDVDVVTARAENLGHEQRYRESFEAVVARAVAALDVLSEYCLPLCRVGGRFVAAKGANGAEEAEGARDAVARLGGGLDQVLSVVLRDVEPRTLVIIDKLRPTPANLPRAPGVPTRRPL